jgi:hypothetical protein
VDPAFPAAANPAVPAVGRTHRQGLSAIGSKACTARSLGPQCDLLSTHLPHWVARASIAKHSTRRRPHRLHPAAAGRVAKAPRDRGPSEAFALFFKNNSGPVFRALVAGTLNRAAAEDATAEAFARAFAQRSSPRPTRGHRPRRPRRTDAYPGRSRLGQARRDGPQPPVSSPWGPSPGT